MSNEGKKIFDAVKQIRTFFSEIARMLKDCDRLMSECGWDAVGTASISGSSTSINIPKKWIPYAVNRIYLNKDVKHTTKAISIIFDDEWKARLEEPVIVGSMYETVDEKLDTLNGWDHTWWWLEFTESNADGQVARINDKARQLKEFARFNDIRLFGLPMVAVSDTDSIKKRIVDVLVGM